ncbi:MAG: sensor domain-containing diguanylate cyclase [Spirochaetales bacterium]|nr:sensor domain-containing diguanylate cyclase [Spirochaetales bacterium]
MKDSSNEKQQDILAEKKYIDNYSLLNELGIFARIDGLNNRIRQQEKIIYQSFEIFHSETVDELVNKLVKIFLEYFIPEHLLVVTQKEFTSEEAALRYFSHMKPAECPFMLQNFQEYKHYFRLNPEATSFDVFSYCVGNSELTDIFLPLAPELVIPLMGMNGVYGFIMLGRKTMREEYSDEERTYINRILQYASISLQNIIHYQRAIYDTKTQMFNFSYFSMRLAEELARTRRYETPASLMILDIDHFKKFNDSYGHIIGDEMLFHIASIIRNTVRREDIPARFGGEEFIVLLIGCEIKQALATAERLREKICTTPLYTKKHQLIASVSIGITEISPYRDLPEAEIISFADSALYNSKENGRNRTSIYKSKKQTGPASAPGT